MHLFDNCSKFLLLNNLCSMFFCVSAYNHEVEAFTPPWLLDGTPRPVIVSYPAEMTYGETYTVTFTGTVDKLSIMTPQSNTHGTSFLFCVFLVTIYLN